MMILWMTCERKAETSSSVEHFVMEDSQILTLEKLWMGYGPQCDLRQILTLEKLWMGYGPQCDLRAYARAYAEPTRKSEPKMDF